MNDIKDTDMSNNEIIEYFRGYDIPDCKKYEELLTSKDIEVVKLAIELLVVDGIDAYQIRRCREKFLHEYHGDQKGFKNIVGYESRHNNSVVSSVI